MSEESFEHRCRDLMARLAQTPLGAEALDENQRRRGVFELLATNPDPIARELGRELGSGNIGISAASAVPAYRDVLEKGIKNLAALDMNAVVGRLETAVETEEEKTKEPTRQDDDDDDIIVFGDHRDDQRT